MLLCMRERDRLQVQAAGKAPSSMYGGEHLLRLLVKLPELLPMTSLPADNYGDETSCLYCTNFMQLSPEHVCEAVPSAPRCLCGWLNAIETQPDSDLNACEGTLELRLADFVSHLAEKKGSLFAK
jgi:MRG